MAGANLISIYLNPDGSPGGMVKVYECHQSQMGVSYNAAIDMTNFLLTFKLINPKVQSIDMVVCISNFAAGGPYNYSISGSLKTHSEVGDLPSWSSKMDSYQIKIY